MQQYNYHAMALVDYLHEALHYCQASLQQFATKSTDSALLAIVQTTLATKYIAKYLQVLSVLAVTAMTHVKPQLQDWQSYFKIIKMAHGNVEDSQVLCNGIVLACKRVHVPMQGNNIMEKQKCIWIQGDLEGNTNQNPMVKRVQVIKSVKDFAQTYVKKYEGITR